MAADKSGIYTIKCAATGEVYVGSSRQVMKRWYAHRHALRRDKNYHKALQTAWNEHGERAFDFQMVEECEIERLREREQFYVDALRPTLNSVRLIPPLRPKPPPGTMGSRRSVLTTDTLEAVGKLLHADNWQSPLARDLEMSERSLRYMAAGERGISAGVVADILAIVKRRRADLGQIALQLAARVAKAAQSP